MLIELEEYINKDKYTVDWKIDVYKKLCRVNVSDEDILYLLKRNFKSLNDCKNWCLKNQYPYQKIWDIVK